MHVFEKNDGKPEMEVSKNGQPIEEEFSKLSLNQAVDDIQNKKFLNYLTYLDNPTQVSLCVIKYCSLILKLCGIAIVSQMFLFYDNMCNLQRLKLWNATDFNQETKLGVTVFNKIKKEVDALHIANHVCEKCRNDNPLVIQQYRDRVSKWKHSVFWLGKFKKMSTL